MKKTTAKFLHPFLCAVILFIFSVPSSRAVTAYDAYEAGLAYYRAGQWDQSILQFKAAVVLFPGYWLAYQMMAFAYIQEADAPDAMDACEKSLAINPNNPTLRDFMETTVRPHWNGTSALSPAAPLPIRDSFYLNLGAMYPEGVGGTLQVQPGVAVGVGYNFEIDKSFSLGLDGRFGTLPYYQNVYRPLTGPIDSIPILTLLANAQCNIVNGDNPVVPYGIFGMGPSFYFGTHSGTYLDFRFGFGLDFRLNPGLVLTYELDGLQPMSNDIYFLSFLGLKFAK